MDYAFNQVWLFLTLLFYVPIPIRSQQDKGLGSDDEVRLVYDLFEKSGYNPLIRPVKNITDSIEVQFNLALSQLINVDEKNQVMKTNVWLQMYWYDYQLKWDPELYGGIKTIRLSHEKAWRPDIVLFNNADGNYEVSYESNIVMNYDSLIYWVPPAIYKSSCHIDVEYFPFDQQVCEMKFGSWTFRLDQLKFTYYGGIKISDFSDYLKSGTWDIIDCPARIENITDPTSGETRSLYIMKYVIRRKTLFYTINLIIPCVLISFVSVCVFALPSYASEKITMCISVLLTLLVFLLLISKILPPAQSIPLLAKYLLFTFIMNILAISLTVFVLNGNYRSPRTHCMPKWVQVVFLKYLPKVLFMSRPETDDDESSEEQEIRIVPNFSVSTNQLNFAPGDHDGHFNIMDVPQSLTTEAGIKIQSLPNYENISLHSCIVRATEAVRFIKEHTQKGDAEESVKEDWKFIASVLDRLLLITFLLINSIGTLVILLKAPHIFEYVDQDEIIEDFLNGKYEVTYESNVVLGEDTGYNIYFIPPAIYQSSCEVDVEYFPFDEQECEMKFGSWTFQADQLNFTYYKFSGLDLTDYLKSGTWDIIECPSRIEICTDPNNGQAKALYIATLKIRRKTLFYTVNLIIPCVLISFVSICVFMLPADAGEKITLIISVLLALVVFLLLISKLLPPSLTIPLIAKYLLFTFIMNIIAIGSTVFVINRNYRTPRTHRMPYWVRVVFLNYLPKFLLMERPDHDTRWQKPDDIKKLQKISSSLQSVKNFDLNKSSAPANILEMTTIRHPGCQLGHLTSSRQEVDATDVHFQLSPELLKAAEAIQFITEHLHSEDRYDTISNDWKYVAAVIDRLLLYIFLLVTICGTLGIIMKAPHIFDNVDQDEIIKDLMFNYNLSLNGDNADGKYEVSYESNILISYDSLVYWIPPAIYKSSCTINVEYFPFDQQVCEMKFGSWTFTAQQLNFIFYSNMDSLDFTDYLKSGTWDIIDCPGRIETMKDPSSGEEKALVIFKLVLRRKTLFYTVNLIIPCVLISFVSVCVFLLPADACEKITLCISVLLALVVFLLLISKILPPSLQIPLVALYLLFTFIMNIFAICLTVFVINTNYRTPRTHRMPYWVRLVFLNYLPTILLMQRPDHYKRWRKPKEDNNEFEVSSPLINRKKNTDSTDVPPNYHELMELHQPSCKFIHRAFKHSEQTECNSSIKMTPALAEGTEALAFITEHIKLEDKYETVLDDWKYVASVLDRLLLIIFLGITLFGTIGILVQAPHIFEYVDQDEIIKNLMAKYSRR